MTIESFETVLLTCIFIIPGFIVNSIISRFVPPKKEKEVIHFLLFLLYSILHCAIWSWLYILIWGIREKNLSLFLLVLTLTALSTSFLLGILIGVCKKVNLLRKILNKFKCNISHSIETSWDYVLSKQKSSYVAILLNDDTKIYGWYGENSFSSSITDENDMFLEKSYDENWNLIESCQGIYIAKAQIKTINFYKGEEIKDGKKS